jgi:hypothetical protein
LQPNSKQKSVSYIDTLAIPSRTAFWYITSCRVFFWTAGIPVHLAGSSDTSPCTLAYDDSIAAPFFAAVCCVANTCMPGACAASFTGLSKTCKCLAMVAMRRLLSSCICLFRFSGCGLRADRACCHATDQTLDYRNTDSDPKCYICWWNELSKEQGIGTRGVQTRGVQIAFHRSLLNRNVTAIAANITVRIVKYR